MALCLAAAFSFLAGGAAALAVFTWAPAALRTLGLGAGLGLGPFFSGATCMGGVSGCSRA